MNGSAAKLPRCGDTAINMQVAIDPGTGCADLDRCAVGHGYSCICRKRLVIDTQGHICPGQRDTHGSFGAKACAGHGQFQRGKLNRLTQQRCPFV
jgi:hypothetical protein